VAPQAIEKEALFKTLPAEWPEDLRPQILARVMSGQRKVVVLDDDPTGTQTVHGIPVVTEWSQSTLESLLISDFPAFYLLTNSRSLSVADAVEVNLEIGRNLASASKLTGQRYVLISRSDSTLRGHFPAEMEALEETLTGEIHGWIIVPFFKEGGRFTIRDVHYVADQEHLVPAGQTEFARDAVFGYKSSNLRSWVEEKTGGRFAADAVLSISIEDLRVGGPARIAHKLRRLSGGRPCIVNAAKYRDLEVFVLALLETEAQGRRFLYRTAASFVPVRAALMSRSLLEPSELTLPKTGCGLFVVGSHVPRTNRQLENLLALSAITGFELRLAALMDDRRRPLEIERVVRQTENALEAQENVVIYTSRQMVVTECAETNLSIGRRVSDALTAVISTISKRPRYLVAKGGITASDIATKGLYVKQAQVLGQILPGVPVWQLGPESRFPGLVYVVFPGNVGGPDALTQTLYKLESRD
jgi:uncharacterized protein YgbK (DUF1537 family)